jgi:hypothetical protein
MFQESIEVFFNNFNLNLPYADPGVAGASPEDVKANRRVIETHPGVSEAHPIVVQAHPGAGEPHP